jgi:hypothetical protein
LNLGADFESVARFWMSKKKHRIVNICTAAALWALWKLRNLFSGSKVDMCSGADEEVSRMLRDWKLVNRREDAEQLEMLASDLERRSFFPPRLCWENFGPNQINTSMSGSVDQVVSSVDVGVITDDPVRCVNDGVELGAFELG